MYFRRKVLWHKEIKSSSLIKVREKHVGHLGSGLKTEWMYSVLVVLSWSGRILQVHSLNSEPIDTSVPPSRSWSGRILQVHSLNSEPIDTSVPPFRTTETRYLLFKCMSNLLYGRICCTCVTWFSVQYGYCTDVHLSRWGV